MPTKIASCWDCLDEVCEEMVACGYSQQREGPFAIKHCQRMAFLRTDTSKPKLSPYSWRIVYISDGSFIVARQIPQTQRRGIVLTLTQKMIDMKEKGDLTGEQRN